MEGQLCVVGKVRRVLCFEDSYQPNPTGETFFKHQRLCLEEVSRGNCHSNHVCFVQPSAVWNSLYTHLIWVANCLAWRPNVRLYPFGASGNGGNQMSRYEIYLWVQSVTRILRRCFLCSPCSSSKNGNIRMATMALRARWRHQRLGGGYGDIRPSCRADH